MIRLAILLGLAICLADGQLNYEGNPLTEYTEYTAEESALSERAIKERSTIGVPRVAVSPSRLQKLYPVAMSGESPQRRAAEADNQLDESSEQPSLSSTAHRSYDRRAFARQLQQFQVASPTDEPIIPAEIALNNFLNSKTPEESRASLDFYLRSQQSPDVQSRSTAIGVSQGGDLGRVVTQMEQRQTLLSKANQPIVEQQLTPRASEGQMVPQVDHTIRQQQQQQQQQLQQQQQQQQQQLLPSSSQSYGQPTAQAMVQPAIQSVIRAPVGVLAPGLLQPVPLGAPGLQARNDVIASAMWRQRMRRLRGKLPFAQARIAPGLYKGSIAVPFKPQGPVEVIYTKPPGFHRGPPVIGNPSVPYEDAGAWFPPVDYPPPSKDVYYSQLYAQSYDPHYYNYIAATGKIRPHLYGKLGKHKEEQDDGIWSELYRGFTKHGLKNIMTPTFLLGMTLPVVTLMLSALVQKRSVARSDARELDDDESALREYVEMLQRAMERYADAKRQDGC